MKKEKKSETKEEKKMLNSSHPPKEKDIEQLSSILFIINVLFVVGNAASSIYRARGDKWELGYIVLVYTNLMGLIVCLRLHDKRETKEIKMAVCAFMTVLCVTLAWGMGGVMEFGIVGKIVCVVVVVFAFAAFGLFVLMQNCCLAKVDDEEKQVVDYKTAI